MKYFTEDIDNPRVFDGEILPNGVCWNYISATFLNVFINYVVPVKCYLMNRYVDWNEEDRRDFETNYQDPITRVNLKKDFLTKQKLYNFVVANPKAFFHTKLDIFNDDIFFLGRVENNPNKYIFFWFDIYCSDCSIGMFTTEDTKEKVIQEFRKYVEETGKNLQDSYLPRSDGPMARELPVDFFNSWLGF